VLGVHAPWVAIGWFVVVISIGSLEAGQTVRGPYEATINRALGLAQAASKVLVVDVTQAARTADAHGRQVEAFVGLGENVVYLISQGARCEVPRRGEGSSTTR
jgi:hypothetical protein